MTSSDPVKVDLSKFEEEPQQDLRIRNLFGLMTLLAVLLAIFSPWVRTWDSEVLVRLSITAAVQFVLGIIYFATLARRRSRFRSSAGKRIGVAYRGEVASPVVGSILIGLLFVLCLCWQVLLSFNTSSLESGRTSRLFIYAPMGIVNGWFFACWYWREFPGAVVFYEHGVSTSLWSFCDWENVELRKLENSEDEYKLQLHGGLFSSYPIIAVLPYPLRMELERLERIPE